MAQLADGRVKTFEHDIEDMRNLTLCKICLKPFYEPFILACGHTYCYSCLNSWFSGAPGRRKRKSCPDCRTEVISQPAPNYLLRDMVHLFINRRELLPEDETIEEHSKGKLEEAARVATDRSGAGLFGGAFTGRGIHPLAQAIIDHEDHVLRCPNCAYELEDGACEQCGWGTPHDAYFSDFTGDDLSDMDDESLASIMETTVHGIPVARPPRFYGIGPEDDSGSDTGYSEFDSILGDREVPNQYDENDDFIDNGNDFGEVEYTDENDDDEVDDDDDDVTGFSDISTAPSTVRGGEFTDTVRSGMPPLWSNRTGPNLAGLQTLSELEQFGPDSDESDPSDYESVSEAITNPTPNRRGRNTVVISDDEDEDGDDTTTADTITTVSTSDSDEGEDDTSATNTTNTTLNSTSASHSDSDSQSNSESEDSDDTILPAQSRKRRQQRLNDHRNRRSNHHSNQTPAPSATSRAHSSTQRGQGRTMASSRQGSRRGRPVGYAY